MDERLEPMSHAETLMVNLANAANSYEHVIIELFDKHKDQMVPIIIVMAANAMASMRSVDGQQIADVASMPDAKAAMAFDDAQVIANRGPAMLAAFLYALGSEVSENMKRCALGLQADDAAKRAERNGS